MFWIGFIGGVIVGWVAFERPKVITEIVYDVKYWLKDKLSGLGIKF